MSPHLNKKARFRWRSLASVGMLVLLVLLAVALIWQANCQTGPSVIAQLRLVSGNTPTIGREESDFYRQLSKKKINGQGSALPLEEEARDYASRVYAQFLIGERLDLCGPFSYALLKQDMEKENQERTQKKQAGEGLDGPDQYDLEGYLEDRLASLKAQIISRLADNPNETLIQNSRAYWERNQDKFSMVCEVSYKMTGSGSPSKNLKREDLARLREEDAQLWEILTNGKEGQSFEYQSGEELLPGKILVVRRETATFDAVQGTVIAAYLEEIEYPQLVTLVAENNPVQLTE